MNRGFGLRISRLLVIVGLCAVASCTIKTSDRNLEFVNPSEAGVAVKGKRGLLNLTHTGEGAYVDPRGGREFRAGHIPGAVHMPLERLQSDYLELNQYHVLVVYGNDYNDPVAVAASKSLIELGFEVRTLRGGLRAWTADGRELEVGENKVEP